VQKYRFFIVYILYIDMLRRLLFILVLCGIIFIVWRLVDPSGADNFLDGIKSFPDRWNSKDVAVDAEPIAER